MSARGSGGSGGGCLVPVLAFILIGLVLRYFVVVVCVAAVVAAVVAVFYGAYRLAVGSTVRLEAERARRSGLIARAEQQHEAFQRGDPAGLYGEYTPAIFPDHGPGSSGGGHPSAAGPAEHRGDVPRPKATPGGLPIQSTARPPGMRNRGRTAWRQG